MTDRETQEDQRRPLAARLAPVLGVIAPTTLVTTLLIYFGYLATRARFEYFGAYLDLVNPSSTDLLFYGSEAVYMAVVALAFATLFGAVLYLAGRWLVSDPRRDTAAGWTGLVLFYAGALLMIRAFMGAFVTRATLTGWGIEAPLALMLGALVLRYSLWLWQERAAHQRNTRWTPPPEAVDLSRYALLVLLIAGLFWTCNIASSLYGRDRAADMAKRLPAHPSVILYTRDAIDSPPSGVIHRDLGKDQKFRHRYSGLALLVESDGRLFLVPVPWSPRTGRVLVVENSADTRLQLIPGDRTRVRR